jgi:hypothetical protein
MKRRFLIATGQLTPEQTQAFLTHVQSSGLAWWHWMPGFWLVIDWSDRVSELSLMQALQSIAPGVYCLVMQVPESNAWAGFGPNQDPQNMFSWLNDLWKG